MHEALALLVDLTPADVDRLLSAGREREVHREDVVIVEGEPGENLFIVLEGVVAVETNGEELVRLGPGELLGELSWLDGRPASSQVRAVEDGVLFELTYSRANDLVADDPAFGTRFLRSLGSCVSRRLRAQNAVHGRAAASDAAPASSVWSSLEPGIEAFKDLMIRAERATQKNGGHPPEEFFAATHEGLDGLCRLLRDRLGDDSGLTDEVRDELGARVRRELHPYLMLTRIVERIYSKPRGYAGDFLTIEWMYRNEPGGTGAAGPLIDTAFLERPAAIAVRNRRHLLADEIQRAVERGGKVMSLACGPAEELFDVFASLDDEEKLTATCVDIDLQALALVSDRRDETGLKRRMRLEQGNLVYLATGRAHLEVEPLDLAYSIGLIDYFEDRFVIALLDWVHDRLRPGGRVVLGNFHPKNPDRELMDHVLDWRLIHRTEGDMNRIFEASKFAAPCTEIRFEEAGVNLFAAGERK